MLLNYHSKFYILWLKIIIIRMEFFIILMKKPSIVHAIEFSYLVFCEIITYMS